MTFVDLRPRLDAPEVRQLLAVLAWTGTDEHLDRICSRYREGRILIGYEVETVLAGCIGIEELGDGNAIIHHIAVDVAMRHQGIGRAMIGYVRRTHGPRSLVAETDQDAVGFYERCGFASRSLGTCFAPGRYPKSERYLCTLGQPPA